MKKVSSFLALFGSLGTLLCCALPVTLVSIGMGATFASLTASFPQILFVTEHKEVLFLVTAALLVVSYISMKNSERLACPIDPGQKEVCSSSKKYSKRFFWATVGIYLIGLSFSYIIPYLIY